MKLQNRFCQDWCKGQVTLFAKDVVEVAEQLPLAPNQVGLVLVVESLENLQRSQEFVVDMNRLYQALTWLMSNNILYRDVRPHFENVIDISELVQISEEPADGGELMELESTPQNNYVDINENVSLLHGSFHQADLRFDLQSRGKQCTAVAAVACAAFCTDEPSQWSKSDIDYIVILGDKLYRESIASRENPAIGEINPEYLAASDLAQQILYNRKKINISVTDTNYNGHIDTDRSTDGFPNLKNALTLFLRENCCGLLTANSMTVAIYCKTETDAYKYWLFDSHARGPKGGKAPKRGAACCMKFQNIDELHDIMRRNLFTPTKKVPAQDYFLNVYSLTPLIITPENQAEERRETLGNQHFNNTQEQSRVVQSESPTYTILTSEKDSPQIFQANSVLEQERLHRDTLRTSESPTYTIPVLENNNTPQQTSRLTSASVQEKTLSYIQPIATIIETTSMLRSIDEAVPDLESIVSLNPNPTTNNNEMRLAEISRKTAPPLNVDRERRMEELAWYCLFPDGKNGFGEERDIQITPLDYFQSRVMSLDKRFNRNDYLFFALSIVEYYRAKSSVSVSCRMRQGQGEQTPQGLIDNMHLTMRNIRGSASYWQKCCSELTAMQLWGLLRGS
ncbi:unnamed protein product [Arctia plantaginis]|uniref:DUF6570 domain-containing protein n=1 Tax=Arctia plantaginis TaxID=874455 RepID=A0A8S0Z3W0_ARCPL|nr:unnamed protein product [Arctia plantaginis]